MNELENLVLTPENFKIEKDFICDTITNREYNKKIIEYYETLQSELYPISSRKIEHISNCNKFWTFNQYNENLVKDFLRTNLCKDKFCNNCKKVKQAARMSRFIPFLEKYRESMYMLTLTVPNVTSVELKDMMDRMTKSFRKLIQYLNGYKKIAGIDFSKYGYNGALRTFECTFKTDDIYHPHFHVGISFKNMDLEKKNKNAYSIDHLKNRGDILFSDFEILIQKIWYLLINKIEVNKKNIDSLELGYSCKLDKFKDDDYIELFKYMTKCTDESDQLMTYENFKTLYLATYHYRQIQGYGCFYMINDDGIYDEVENLYADIRNFLNSEESPIRVNNDLHSLLNENMFTLISRKKIYEYLKSIKPDNQS